jgi:uncharacterized membrane protein
MNKVRLEAFSDGVLAIIITIMVLEIHVPDEANWEAFTHVLPMLTAYVLSFIYIGIYWNNHHHMMHAADHVTPAIMWSNHNLLFWLSLVPFATAWMDKSGFAPFAVVVYAILLALAGTSFNILRRAIYKSLSYDNGMKSALATIDAKSQISVACCAVAAGCAYWQVKISLALCVLVAIMWLIPSKAIEKKVTEEEK